MKSLSQKRWFHGERTFEIVDGNKVKINVASISKSYEDNVNICDLESTYEKFRTREIKWLLYTIPSLLIILALVYESIDLSQPVHWGFVALFGVPAAVCVQQFFYRQDDLVIFRNKRTGGADLWFWNNKPGEDELNDFVGEIENLAKTSGLNKTVYDDLPYLMEEQVSITSLASILAAIPFVISDLGEDYLKVKFENLAISVTLLENIKSLKLSFGFPLEEFSSGQIPGIVDEMNRLSKLVKYTSTVYENKNYLAASYMMLYKGGLIGSQFALNILLFYQSVNDSLKELFEVDEDTSGTTH